MEKGYHAWAPGEHYGFDWIVPPCEVGYEGSVERAYEFDLEHPIVITRQSITKYPFTKCYEHCWMGATHLGPADTLLIHMYQDGEGGMYWRSIVVTSKEGVDFVIAHQHTRMKFFKEAATREDPCGSLLFRNCHMRSGAENPSTLIPASSTRFVSSSSRIYPACTVSSS